MSPSAAADLDEAQKIDVPDICWHLWQIFVDLHAKRGSNGFGPNPISEAEVFYYCANRGISLSREELYLLSEADKVARKQMADNAEVEKNIR